jgi:integrase
LNRGLERPRLSEFIKFYTVDLQLKEISAQRHMKRIERFLRTIGKSPEAVRREDVRDFLYKVKHSCSPWTYKNELSTLKRFFRDFLGRENLVQGFKFPRFPFQPQKIPNKEELKTFYQALENERYRLFFLLYASSGLRESELITADIDFTNRMLIPRKTTSETKKAWVSFYTQEAEDLLTKYGLNVFKVGREAVNKVFRKTSRKCSIRITPTILRKWFCCEMGRLGVPDRFVDAFCGRTPKSVLARHYTDYSPNRLKEIYENAGLTVLR